MEPLWPGLRLKGAGHDQVIWTLSGAHAPSTRWTTGGGSKPMTEVPVDGTAGSTRSNPRGRQSVMTGWTSALADVVGTATSMAKLAEPPGSTADDGDVRRFANSTESGTTACWTHALRLTTVVPGASPETTAQFLSVLPAATGSPSRPTPSAGTPARSWNAAEVPAAAGPKSTVIESAVLGTVALQPPPPAVTGTDCVAPPVRTVTTGS